MKRLLRKIKYIIKDKIARVVMTYFEEEYENFRGKK